MIFYGTKATNLRNGQIINVDCPGCSNVSNMKYSVFAKCAHVYWIPFFPVSKITITECNSCKKTYEYKDLPDSIKAKFAREKEKDPVRYPVWMFSGIFIILGLIGFGFYDSHVTDENTAAYVKKPKAGDVYFIRTAQPEHFTAVRVDKISRTELYVTNNDYEVTSESGFSELDETKNYTNSKDTLSFFDLQQAYKKGTIIEVKRN